MLRLSQILYFWLFIKTRISEHQTMLFAINCTQNGPPHAILLKFLLISSRSKRIISKWACVHVLFGCLFPFFLQLHLVLLVAFNGAYTYRLFFVDDSLVAMYVSLIQWIFRSLFLFCHTIMHTWSMGHKILQKNHSALFNHLIPDIRTTFIFGIRFFGIIIVVNTHE